MTWLIIPGVLTFGIVARCIAQYCEVEDLRDARPVPQVRATWRIVVRPARGRLWYVVEGWYDGNPETGPQHIFAVHSPSVRTGRDRVAYWIDDAELERESEVIW